MRTDELRGAKIIGQRPTKAQLALHALRLVNGERTGLQDLLKEAEGCEIPESDRCQISNRLIDLERQRQKIFRLAFPSVLGAIASNEHEIDKAVKAALTATE